MVGARSSPARARPSAAATRALEVLVILDGASEPLREGRTSLERARTPALDALAAEGAVTALRTVPPGLPAGSETAIPALLGWTPAGPLDRAAIEAAAHGIDVGAGERAWRVDRRDRGDAAATAHALAAALRDRGLPHRVHRLAGHRMLVVGPEPLPAFVSPCARGRGGLRHDPACGVALDLLVWASGAIPSRAKHDDGRDERTVVVGARGAAVGIARLMGARAIVPPGATGRPGSDLAAKAAAAIAAIDGSRDDRGGGSEDGRHGGGRGPSGGGRARRVVVHVGGADEAAHERDAEAKVAAIEAADAHVVAPLARALRERRASWGEGSVALRVCPDHGCDPATGEHDAAPVPCLDWPAARPSGGRLTERAVAGLEAVEPARTGEATSARAAAGAGREAVAA